MPSDHNRDSVSQSTNAPVQHVEGNTVYDARPNGLTARLAARHPAPHPVRVVAEILLLGYIALGSLLLGIGLLLVHVLPTGWDEHINRWMVGHRSSWLNGLTRRGTMMANTVPVVAIIVVVCVVSILARRWRDPLLLVAAIALELSMFLAVNYTIGRPRPDVVRLDSTPSTFSYPSGHIAATVVVWVGLALIVRAHTRHLILRNVALFIATCLSLFVGFARVYRGMHHLTDVAAGALLGLGSLAIAMFAVRAAGAVSKARNGGRQDVQEPRPTLLQ